MWNRGAEMGDEMLTYSKQWNISAKYFYDKGYYSWMADKLSGYKNVLEVGCGTGYSTLALVEKGYKVIAIDKNVECLNRAKKLLSEKGYTNGEVAFIEGDIAENLIRDELVKQFEFDVVICWNIGTYWDKQTLQSYIPYMNEYGLTAQQIVMNPKSSYSELIIWETCRLAKAKGVASHIVDRAAKTINEQNDNYYCDLRDEFDFHDIVYDSKEADSISNGGIMLTKNGIMSKERKVDVIFTSIMYK